jgi:hypothetical protein
LKSLVIHDHLHAPIINELPPSGSPCIRNQSPLQAHLVLEETRSLSSWRNMLIYLYLSLTAKTNKEAVIE